MSLARENGACPVIRDLMPSYLEGICSKESRELVERHLAECPECRKLSETLKEEERTAEREERIEFDYLKKVKHHILRKEMSGFAIWMGVLVFFLAVVMRMQGNLSVSVYFITMPIVMLTSYLLLCDYVTPFAAPEWKEKRKKVGAGWNRFAAGLEGVFFAYSVALLVWEKIWLVESKYPFGMEAHRLGPFVYGQCAGLVLLQLLWAALLMRRSIKQNLSHTALINLCILGCYVNLIHMYLLHQMSEMETFLSFRAGIYAVLAAEGIGMAIILLALEWKRGRNVS